MYCLNEAWQTEHGGALRLYLADQTELDVLPSAGTLVLFISAELPHEVLPATTRTPVADRLVQAALKRTPRAPERAALSHARSVTAWGG